MNIDGNATISSEHKSQTYSADLSEINSSEQDSDSSSVTSSFCDEFVDPFVEEMKADPGPEVCKEVFQDLIADLPGDDQGSQFTPALYPWEHLKACLYEVRKRPHTNLSETKYELSHDQVVLTNELIKRVKERLKEDWY